MSICLAPDLAAFTDCRVQSLSRLRDVITSVLQRLCSVVHSLDGRIVGTSGSLWIVEHEAILACH